MPKEKEKSVGAIVLNNKNQVLLIWQTQNKFWEFPKGKNEEDENELETLKREVKEEIGVEKFSLFKNFREKTKYWYRRPGGTLIEKEVIFYLIRTGEPIKLSSEHNKYKWVDIDEAITLLKHQNQKELLALLKSFI